MFPINPNHFLNSSHFSRLPLDLDFYRWFSTFIPIHFSTFLSFPN